LASEKYRRYLVERGKKIATMMHHLNRQIKKAIPKMRPNLPRHRMNRAWKI